MRVEINENITDPFMAVFIRNQTFHIRYSSVKQALRMNLSMEDYFDQIGIPLGLNNAD